MAEYVETNQQQLADELSALLDQFIAKLPLLSTPTESRQVVYGYLSVPEEFRHTAIATVADSEVLQTVQRLHVDEARAVQQFSEAFRPLALKIIAAGEALDFTIDVRLSRLNRGALQIYAIAKEISRDRVDLQTWVGEMRRHLKRRTHRGQAVTTDE
jgi:hypothetical protein